MKPNKERLRLWVEDLRTTTAKQGRGHLLQDGAFCCLGRACEVYRKATGHGEWLRPENENLEFIVGTFGNSIWLPGPVAKWFGVDRNPEIAGYRATDWNDGGANNGVPKTFREIANIIEHEYDLNELVTADQK